MSIRHASDTADGGAADGGATADGGGAADGGATAGHGATTTHDGPGDAAPGAQRHGKWWPLAAVCIAVFMLLIDVTVVNVALPDIQSELRASFSDLQWVVDAYALTLAAFQLTSGSLGDRIGRKPVFMGGIALFALSSLACGLAPTPGTLDVFRAIQGIGGAVMFANSLAIIGENYAGRDRGTAFGVWGATTGASIAIGPLLGGALTSGLGWRWIFFVNLPIGAAALLLSGRRLGHSVNESGTRIDWAGFALFSVGLAALVYALIRGTDTGWTSPVILGLFATAFVTLAAFLVVERRIAQPMLDVRLFRRPGFSGAQVAAFSISASLFALFLYFTLYLQDILGYSAFGAGLRLMPITAVTFLFAPLAGKLSATVPYRALIGAGLVVVGVGLFLVHGLTAASGWTALLAGFALSGAGSGMINPPLGSLAVSVVERERSGMGAGINNTFRQVGLATGIAVLGALFEARVSHTLASLAPRPAGGRLQPLARAVSSGGIRQVLPHVPPAVRSQVAHAARVAFVSGLNELLWIGAAVAAGGAVLCLVLIRQRDLVSGHAG